MKVLYMSYGGAHGEYNAVMSVEEMKHFIATGFGIRDLNIVMPKIYKALEDEHYWHGNIGPYLVVIVTLDYVRTLLDG